MKKVLLVLVIALAVTSFACQKKAAVTDNASVDVETVIIDEVVITDNMTPAK